jgi:hypothetical protein
MGYAGGPEYDDVVDLVREELQFQNEFRDYGLSDEAVVTLGGLLGDQVIYRFHLTRRSSPGN